MVLPLLGGLVLGDLGLLAGAGGSVSTAGSVHALEGLALLACGRGGGLEIQSQYEEDRQPREESMAYLTAAVNGRVLANAVDLVAGRGVDDVVRLGSVARHGCGSVWWFSF